MAKYASIESWASRLGYIVEHTPRGYVWHRENEQARGILESPMQVVEAILEDLRLEYGGEV